MLTIRLSTRPDRQWGSQTRPCAWHLNSARGLAILASGLQKVGPEPSSSLLSLSTKRICNLHYDENNTYSPALIILLLICVIWSEMQIGLFYNLDVAHSKIVWKMAQLSLHHTNSVNRQDCICLSKKWKLGNNVGMKFRQRLNSPPNISPTCPLQIHAQSPSFMHSSGLDLIGNH